MRALLTTIAILLAAAATGRAHDQEGTRVVLSFAADGRFVLDITHNPDWLLLRLESFAGGTVPARISPAARDARLHQLGGVIIDRVVLWVDGRESRPDSAEYLAAERTFRLSGRVPLGARSLRWLYGQVGDPYAFIVRRADSRTLVEQIEGSNWSGTFDIAGQFNGSRSASANQITLLVGLFTLGLAWRLRVRRPRDRGLRAGLDRQP